MENLGITQDPCATPGTLKELRMTYSCGYKFPYLDENCRGKTFGGHSDAIIHHSGLWGEIVRTPGCSGEGMIEITSEAQWNHLGYGMLIFPHITKSDESTKQFSAT